MKAIKKIFTLGHTTDHMRFFRGISKHERNINFIHFCCNLSGRVSINPKLLFENVKYLPFRVRANKKSENPNKLSHNKRAWIGEYLINFFATSEINNISDLYFNYFYDQIKKQNPDLCLIWGDTRLQCRALITACKILSINYYVLEQSAFGHTICDKRGANVNSSFSQTLKSKGLLSLNLSTDYHLNKNIVSTEKINPNNFLRLCDLFNSMFLLKFGFYELKEEKTLILRLKASIRQLLAYKEHRHKKGDILLVGQVPTDANILLYSPIKSHTEMIEQLLTLFPNKKITFREHPLFKFMYEKELYELVHRKKNISISNDASLSNDIESHKVIVVINSTSGIECLIKHKRMPMIFGNAYYDKLVTIPKNQIVEGNDALNESQSQIINEWFFSNHIQGSFRDKDLKQISESISKLIYRN